MYISKLKDLNLHFICYSDKMTAKCHVIAFMFPLNHDCSLLHIKEYTTGILLLRLMSRNVLSIPHPTSNGYREVDFYVPFTMTVSICTNCCWLLSVSYLGFVFATEHEETAYQHALWDWTGQPWARNRNTLQKSVLTFHEALLETGFRRLCQTYVIIIIDNRYKWQTRREDPLVFVVVVVVVFFTNHAYLQQFLPVCCSRLSFSNNVGAPVWWEKSRWVRYVKNILKCSSAYS